MTTTIVFPDEDAQIGSQDASYATALAGSSLALDTSSERFLVGQTGSGGSQEVSTWLATWSASWYGYGKRSTNRCYQGNTQLGDGTGDQYSKIGFNATNIQNTLSGATINKVRVRLKNEHTWYVASSTCRIGTHDNGSEPGGSTSTDGNFNRDQADFARGEKKWVTLPDAIGEELRDGTYRGLTLGRTGAGNRSDYGYWTGTNGGSTTKPKLEITYTAGLYKVRQAFLGFSVTEAGPVATAWLRLFNDTTYGAANERRLRVYEYDFGTLGTGDFRTPSQLNALDRLGELVDLQLASNSSFCRLPFEDPSPFETSQTFRVVMATRNNENQDTPSGSEDNHYATSDASGTSQDPALYFSSYDDGELDRVAHAQVQLSDGTHAYLLVTDDNADLELWHHDGDNAALVASGGLAGTFGIGNGVGAGAQAVALVADDEDNLYLVGRNGGTSRTLAAQAFDNDGANNFTAKTALTQQLNWYASSINQVVAAWHDRGTDGAIVALVSFSAGRNNGTPNQVAFLNCSALLAGSGTLFRANIDAAGALVPDVGEDGFNNWWNDTGTGLDMAAAPGTTDRGFVVSQDAQLIMGNLGPTTVARYVVNATGDGFSSTSRKRWSDGDVYAVKDANTKTRLLPISTSQLVTIAANETTDYGLVVRHHQNIGTSTDWTILSTVRLDQESLSTMPPASELAGNQLWDAFYDPDTNSVVVYYFDDADDMRLMRTSIDLDSGQANGDEVEVNAAVAASSNTNATLAVHRGETQGEEVLVRIATETSGGTQSTVLLTDQLNVAPNAPVLTAEPNFDATTEQILEWTFSDPNPGDSQSAYELEIVNATGGSNVVDTGKVTAATAEQHTLAASTLSNGSTWNWRVRTWDSQDEVGPFSGYGSFQTSSSGTVDITDPATDNVDGINTSDYTITWSVSGTTQVDYRVKLIRVLDEVTIIDTDWVTSTDVTYLIEDMVTDVEYRIEVTVRDGSMVETNTATRLITPAFSSPQQPTVSTSDGTGYIEVTVANPAPEGDEPEAGANQIFRRLEGSEGPFTLVGSTVKDGTFNDYLAAPGVTYEYFARAQAVAPETT